MILWDGLASRVMVLLDALKNDTMIRNPCLNKVHKSAFECSKVLKNP